MQKNETTGSPGKLLALSNNGLSFRLIAILLFTMTGSACVLPPYMTSLDKVLQQKEFGGKDNDYQYRCTQGAHRGASAEHLENSLAALLAADSSTRYAFIEFDVQYSQDQKIVVYHDRRMLRLFGSMKAICNTTFTDLVTISDGEIILYDDVIGKLNKKLNIEIKSRGNETEDRGLVDEIITDLQRRDRLEDVLLSSISPDVLQYVKQHYPAVKTGRIFWLTSSTYLHFEGLTQQLYEDIASSQADYIMLHEANLRNIEDLLALKPKGTTLVFWDFDDTMYIVHKDLSDRLWGDSAIKTFCWFLLYSFVSFFS
jgi:glycerophosphoryl diester phosphodiesterase